VLATLSRWRSSVQIRSGTPLRLVRNSAVRKLAKRRSSNLRVLWVRLPPVLLEHASVGHWQASVAVTHPLSSFAGSTPARRTENTARSFRGRTPGSHPGEAGSIPARVTDSHSQVVERQTRDAQNVVPSRAWEFKSPLGYLITRVGQRPDEPHKLRTPGATPGPATHWPGTQTGKATRSRAS
jgi:hypothetical protein